MKKFLIKLFIYFSVIMLFCIGMYISIDPYNVYHWNCLRDNGIEPNKNYIKTRFLIENPTKFDSYVFGSSRVGALHVEKLEGVNAYNMTYSQATFEEERETLQVLIDNNVKINRIYLGVDNASFCDGMDYHSKSAMHCSYSKAKNPITFFWIFMNPHSCFNSLFAGGNVNEGFKTFYEYGWDIDYNRQTNYDWSSVKGIYNEYCDVDYSLKCISEIKRICDCNGIDLIVFTNPMYVVTHKAAVDYNDYYYFLKELAEITDYYNFSGINDVTLSSDNYIDPSHYRAEVGDLMLDILEGKKERNILANQGFGLLVNRSNVDEVLALLENQYSGRN